MPAEIIRLPKLSKRQRRAPHAMPEQLSLAEVTRLLRLARGERFTLAQVLYATRTVRFWAVSCGRHRADWVMVIINGMRTGWALRGFEKHRARFVMSWLNSGVNPDEPLTRESSEATLQALSAHLEARKARERDSRKPGEIPIT